GGVRGGAAPAARGRSPRRCVETGRGRGHISRRHRTKRRRGACHEPPLASGRVPAGAEGAAPAYRLRQDPPSSSAAGRASESPLTRAAARSLCRGPIPVLAGSDLGVDTALAIYRTLAIRYHCDAFDFELSPGYVYQAARHGFGAWVGEENVTLYTR